MEKRLKTSGGTTALNKPVIIIVCFVIICNDLVQAEDA